eukprot:11181869-Lingulodinium_polyedra.AAC.1
MNPASAVGAAAFQARMTDHTSPVDAESRIRQRPLSRRLPGAKGFGSRKSRTSCMLRAALH